MRNIVKHTAVAVAGALATLGLASPALAAGPTGEYAVFNECPLSVANINACVYSLTTSGGVKIGSSTTPITNPIVFQGGETREATVTESEVEVRGEKEVVREEQESRKFVPAANGETLSHSPQPIPGGLLGVVAPESLPAAVREQITALTSAGLAGVNATTELVGPAEFSFPKLASKDVGLVMPTRIHLESTLLGSECYIGSASEPITFHLTTGATSPPPPNEPISGSPGEVEVRNGGKLVISHNDSAVDNLFSVPTANGCGGSLAPVLDQAIDLKLGLPSASGNNTAILTGTLEQASAGAVQESEG
jgi:hypothetical protein